MPSRRKVARSRKTIGRRMSRKSIARRLIRAIRRGSMRGSGR